MDGFRDGQRFFQHGGLILQLQQAGACGGGDDPLLDRGDDVSRRLSGGGELTLHGDDLRVAAGFPTVRDHVLRDPLDHIVAQDIVTGQLGDALLDLILFYVMLFAAAAVAAAVAGVIVIQRAAFPGAGSADHIGSAIPAAELPGKQIIGIALPFRLRCFSNLQFFLHSPKRLLFDDGRDPVFLYDPGIVIRSDVVVVAQQTVKAVFVPHASVARADAACVQVGGDGGKCFAAQVTAVDLAHDGGGRLVDGVESVDILIPERQTAVDPAIGSIVGHAAADILCHVFGIELVHVHHRAQGKAACGSVAEFLLRIHGADAVGVQLAFVAQGVEHVAGDAVRLVGDDHLKFPLFRVAHHTLKGGALIGAAADGLVRVHFDDIDIVRLRKRGAFFDLLLDAFFALAVRTEAGVDHADDGGGLRPGARGWHNRSAPFGGDQSILRLVP